MRFAISFSRLALSALCYTISVAVVLRIERVVVANPPIREQMIINLVDRYARTFIDFWTLRPRKFMSKFDQDSSKYLSPYQFLYVSLCFTFFVFISEIGLTATALRPGYHPASASAGWSLSVFGLMFALNSLAFRTVSRVWPIRGSATFSSIFEIQCYTMAIYVPLMLLGLVLSPLSSVPLSFNIQWIVFAIGFVYGIPVFFLWQIPAVAIANRVSSARVIAGFLFWSAVLGFAITLLAYLAFL